MEIMYYRTNVWYNIIGGRFMAEFKFELVKQLGVLSESAKGWKKELNLISWNGREPKYDIREWDPAHEKMGKGVTLSAVEFKELQQIINQIDI